MAEVRYVFTETGADAVERAFSSIGSTAERSMRRAQTAAKKASAAIKREARKTEATARAPGSAAKRERSEQAARLKEIERAEAKADRVRARYRLQRVRAAKRAKAKELRDAQRAEARAQKVIERTRTRRRRAVGRFVAGGGRAILRGASRLGAAGIGIAGAATAHAVANQDKALQLAIKGGRRSDGSLTTAPTDITSRVSEVTAGIRGTKSSELLDAIGAFVSKTGDLPQALNFAEEFAKISVATGTNLQDVGSAAADLMEKFDIRTVEDMGDALSVLSVQGKRGAFELEDAASQFPKIAAAAASFGLSGKKGLAQLGGLTQIARRATGSPEQAATAVQNLFKQIIAKSGDIKKGAKVEVFADPKTKTKARSIQDLLPEIIKGVGGDLEKLGSIFPKMSIAAIQPLIKVFNDAANQARAAGRSEKEARAEGEKAVRAELAKAIDATGARAEIEKDAARAQQAASAQITAAWETIVTEIGAKFAPAVADAAVELRRFCAER